MTEPIPDLAAAFTEADTLDREAVAEEVRNRCQNTQDPTVDDARAVFEVLRTADGAVRQTLSTGFGALSETDRSVVAPLVGDVLSFLAADPPNTRVRIDLARAAGAGIAADPAGFDERHLFVLFSLLHDDEPSVRHSAAWSLELLAFARTMKVGPRATELAAHVDDPHLPVGKHVCRALAHVVRTHQHADVPVAKAVDRLDVTDTAVRTAASVLLGAVGSETAVGALRDRLSREPDPDVREDIRHALREATFPGPVESTDVETVDEVGDGEWLVVGSTVPLRTGRLRGRSEGRAPDGSLQASNPYEGYRLELRPDSRTVRYLDRRTSDALEFQYTSLGTIPSWRVPLLYAGEGDTLTVELDRREYTLAVTAVETGEGERRVTGADQRGNEIEFRPFGDRPELACFRRGRCFEIRSACLEADSDQ